MSEAADSVERMDIVLIPGFWLDASSWDPVVPVLEARGHRVHALTLPGKESPDADRSGIGLRDHIDAVVAVLDGLSEPAVLVGHSGGGAIAHGAADARPDKVRRVVYVDSGPLGHGGVINDELPVAGDEIPLPDWEVFEDEDLRDLDETLRERFRATAIPEPKGVASEQQELRDPRRYDVPVSVICCEFPSEMLREFMASDHPYTAELKAVKQKELLDLPTGHWPQFTRPDDLAELLADVVGH
jgi:pimeloyl-ACP methyl ester carboxylesterase